MAEQPQNVSLRIDDSQAKATYANAFRHNATTNEVARVKLLNRGQ